MKTHRLLKNSPSENFISSLIASIRRFHMLKKGDAVVVAVSGGPDSVALLYALCELREDWDITLTVAHLNHCLRREQSDEDARYVRDLSDQLGLQCIVDKADVPSIQKMLRMSEEETARIVRYDFLEQVADAVGAQRIAIGHTADDQVETILLNLMRGTGLDGLAGMPAVRGRFIRPLIEIRRTAVLEYLNELGVTWRTDETNLVPNSSRNKVRLELLPLLRQNFNPEIDVALLRLAEISRAEAEYMIEEARRMLNAITFHSDENGMVVDAHALSLVPPAMRRRIIREIVKTLKGDIVDLGFIHVEDLVRLLESGRHFRREIGGVFVERMHKDLVVSKTVPDDYVTYSYQLKVPGKTFLPEIEAVVETALSDVPVDFMRERGAMEVVLDADKVKGIMKARSWQYGDRICPLGMSGSKKLQDVFCDAKVPRVARTRVPVIVDEEKVLWVAGLAVSRQAMVTPNSKRFLILRILEAPR